MKLLGTTQNLVNTVPGSNWLITSDKPIDQNSYYFELEILSRPNYSTGYIGYLYKSENGAQHAPGEYWYKGSFCTVCLTYENQVYNEYFSILQDPYFNISKTITPNDFLSSRIGLGIRLKSDKTVNFDIYLNGKLKDQLIKENFEDFDFNNLYIATFNQWNHNNQTAQYYFEKDLKYQNIASKYLRNAVLFESGGGGGCIK